MNWVKEYYRRIECGDIVTSKRVRAVYSRLVAEMDAANDDSPYYFDEETGERPILFIETFCKQSQGTIGAPLELELYLRYRRLRPLGYNRPYSGNAAYTQAERQNGLRFAAVFFTASPR